MIPKVKQTGDRHPMKFQVRIGMFCKKFLDTFAVVRMCQEPDLMGARKLPGPVPRVAWLSAQAGATCETNNQYFHWSSSDPILKTGSLLGERSFEVDLYPCSL